MRNLFAAVALLSIFVCGCARTEKAAPRQRMAMGVPHGKVEYKPVSAEGLELRCFGKTTFQAGRPATLTFALSNQGYRKVRIPEWYSNESDNIGLFIQPVASQLDEPKENKWVRLTFDFKKPILHYPITLMPGNQALVSKELDIVEKMMIPPGEERLFLVKAELTLDSLNLSSRVILIRVTSNIQR